MKKIILFLSVLVCSIAHAQVSILPPLTTVNGEAQLKVKPDVVLLKVSVARRVDVAVQGTLGSFLNVFDHEKNALNFLNIDKENITETLIQIQSRAGQVMLVKDFYITLDNIKKLEDLLQRLYSQGFDNVLVVEYRISQLNVLIAKARLQAIDNAKSKASAVAAQLGQTIGTAYSIEEEPVQIFNPYQGNSSVTFPLVFADGYSQEPGYVSVLAKVKVSFNLK